MGRPRKEELRELKEEEQKELKRVVKATSERVDTVKRAKALLAVAAGATLTAAGRHSIMIAVRSSGHNLYWAAFMNTRSPKVQLRLSRLCGLATALLR